MKTKTKILTLAALAMTTISTAQATYYKVPCARQTRLSSHLTRHYPTVM